MQWKTTEVEVINALRALVITIVQNLGGHNQ